MIGAIIVLYKPDVEQVSIFLSTLSSQVDDVVIVDNSVTSHENTLIKLYTHYIHFPSNKGIASAHNAGLSYLIEKGSTHAIIFDQDSLIEQDLVDSLYNKMKELTGLSINLAAIGPQVICKYSNQAVLPKIQRDYEHISGVSLVSQIIASGMLIDLSVIDIIGFKEDSLFIDGVDHEWCWRAKQNGYFVGLYRDEHMVHALGDSRSNVLGISYKVGSPVRLYYQFRNLFILSKRNYVPFYWKLRHLTFIPIKFFLMAIFENSKKERIKYMIKGFIDGILGKQGKY